MTIAAQPLGFEEVLERVRANSAALKAARANADAAERLQRTLDAIEGATCGVDTIAPSLLLARIAAAAGVPFAAARAACRADALREIFKSPQLAWRK